MFPGLFIWGWACWAVADLVRTRKLDRGHLKFLAGGIVATIVLVGAAYLAYGPEAFEASLVNLKLHASAESYSSYRTSTHSSSTDCPGANDCKMIADVGS